ncbi:MAG: class I tRNA ligase family protein, partial [Akkermansiaceae bacterium]
QLYTKYGADNVRLWASSVDWQNEVPLGEDLFKQVAEPYRRLRNTLRILLGNLDGFNQQSTIINHQSSIPLLDAWILERLHVVVKECLTAYESFEFRKVFNSINQFCTTDLSAIYIDALKDRMYCDAADSPRRLASQAAMYEIFSSITRLLAPILAYTADEAWEHAAFTNDCVHEQDFPTANPAFAPSQISKDVERLFQIKAVIQTAIEAKIQAKEFTRNNEAAISLTVPASDAHLLEKLTDRDFATEFFIIAELKVTQGTELSATAAKTELPLCPRCRRHEPVLESGLCARCDEVVA